MKVEKATERDLRFILDWLKREYDEDGDGFWCNERVIRDSFSKSDDLWVVRIDGQAVSYQVGNDMRGIINVRKNMRGHGIGAVFVEATIARAKANNITALYGECAPISSQTYWEKFGFQRYHHNGFGGVWVRLLLHCKHTLPEDSPTAQVRIEFIAAREYYRDRNSPIPLSVYDLTGAVIDDSDVMLPERVIAFMDDVPEGHDMFVKVRVNGNECYFGKAKYDDAEAVGVNRDHKGRTFYIDSILDIAP